MSMASILLYTAPCFVMLMSATIFGEKITVQKAVALLIAFLGCVLTTGIVGNRSVTITTVGILTGIGSGIGYYITDGYAIPITWSKSGRKEQTVYKKKNGEEIKVNDGNTYIQNAPSNSGTIS